MSFEKREIASPELPTAVAPLSQGIQAGQFLFVSGQVPRDPVSMTIPEGIEAQTEVVIQNLERVLVAAGSSLADIVKVTAHLADLKDRDGFNAVYSRMIPKPYPSRTTVGSQLGGILVEVDVIAVKPS